MAETEVRHPRNPRAQAGSPQVLSGAESATYAIALVASCSIWYITIRSPLWLDETDSSWQISAGFSQIWHRQFESLCFPAYTYILWLFTKIIGTSEIALRIPSILAMLGAVYLLFLAARELFNRQTALIACIVFCLHSTIIFESIDARPYAFGVLATNAAILLLLRLRHSESNWLAALFGLCSAFILYFHYLFASILPALVISFFIVKTGGRKASTWRQFAIAAFAFTLAFLPAILGLRHLFCAPGTHVFEPAPRLVDLLFALAPLPILLVGAVVGFLAFLTAATTTRAAIPPAHIQRWRVLVCVSLALIPTLILYGISAATPIHMFVVDRHRLVAVPGVALCTALIVSKTLSRPLRLLFCLALVATTLAVRLSLPENRRHGYTWKYALDAAEKNVSVDNAPVLICSDIPEAAYQPVPLDSPKTSHLFPQLSYYQVTFPVVPMPRTLNSQAVQVGSQFLQQAVKNHQRFLAVESGVTVGFTANRSYDILDWLANQASPNFEVHNLGTFDYVEVLEFTPRSPH